MKRAAPPPVIAMSRVLEYAVVDASVQWTGRQRQFVNSVAVGPVPLLVLAQRLMSPRPEFVLLFCDEEWESVSECIDSSIEEAKKRAERYYQGISAKWVRAEATPEEVERWFRETPQGQAYICSFCGGLPTETDGLFGCAEATICFNCVREMHARITAQESKDGR